MKLPGIFLIVALFAAPLIWVPGLMTAHPNTTIVSQLFGIWALLAMATRVALVERVFGGMDQVYRLHKWLGIGLEPLFSWAWPRISERLATRGS